MIHFTRDLLMSSLPHAYFTVFTSKILASTRSVGLGRSLESATRQMSKRAFGRRSSKVAHGWEDGDESLQACTLIPLLTSGLTAWQTSRCSRRSAQTTAEGWICDPQEHKVFSSRSDRLTFSAHPPSIITEKTRPKLMGNNFLYGRKMG